MKDKVERWSGLPLEAETQSLSGELGRSLLFTHLLQQRVGTDRDAIDRFLQPRLGAMADPALMGDASRAARRILDAVAADEPMLIYGDYDVDGMTSVALLTLFFRHGLNHSIRSYLPQRLRDGYGLNIDMIERFAAEGIRLIITVDNGSSAVEAAARAQALGVDLVVVDHHQVSDPEPALFAHLNPNRAACAYPEEGLAAVGVAFILLVELRRQLRVDPRFQLPELRLERFLDLVALGTLVDMAPMRGLNRALVRAGLEQLRRSEWPGLRALCQAQKLQPQKLRCRDIGFSLGPPLNASGRLGDPGAGARLLSAESHEEASTLCERVLEYNRERREIQRALFEAAEPLAEAQVEAGRSLILIGDAGWHQGVVGIIAGRIAERFQRPTVVLGSPGQRGP
ncbi:MAG: DHH family phosphoesterase, partial [Myxococcota bacterium]|nr:DHH family phosphoesterase [Myxococcota bacterium]